MELHHYTEALECLNECLEYYSDSPDVYFRRSQARIYNKFSMEESNLLALIDIKKAIKLKSIEDKMYQEHLEKVEERIKQVKNENIARINGKYLKNLYH